MVARALALLLASILTASCDTGGSSTSSSPNDAADEVYTGEYIYVASGTAYAGLGITPITAVNTVVRFKATDGSFDRIVRDFSSTSPDTPVDIAPYDDDHILVLVENAASRRVEIVAKDGSSYATWISNATALSAQLRRLFPTTDGGLLVSKGSAIEKFSSSGARVTQGANAYIQGPLGTCATSATLISGIALGPSNNIFFTHANTAPHNQINIVSTNGYAIAGDCLGGIDGPSANHMPTHLLYHSSGKMLVSYGNNTGPVHQVYSYTVTANSIASAVQAFNNTSVLQGISAMTEDADGYVYIASAASTFNTVEKFSFDSTTGTLTRVGSTPFIGPNVFTRSVSGMLIE